MAMFIVRERTNVYGLGAMASLCYHTVRCVCPGDFESITVHLPILDTF